MLFLILLNKLDSSEGANFGICGTPFSMSPVFSRFQVILTSSVVWFFIENPVTIKYMAGVNIIVSELLKDMGTVFSELHHLTSELFLLVDLHSEWTTVL